MKVVLENLTKIFPSKDHDGTEVIAVKVPEIDGETAVEIWTL